MLASDGCNDAVVNALHGAFAGLPESPRLSPGCRNEFHAGLPAGVREVPGGRRRIHLEVHAQRLRLQRVWAARRSRSRSSGTIRKFRDMRSARACRTSTGSTASSWSSRALRRAFSRRRSAASAPTPARERGSVFRIDHDEMFNQTTHLQYQPWKRGPWFGFNWRYDSGLVAGPVPCAGGNCDSGPNDYRCDRGCIRTDAGSAIPSGTVLRRRVCHADDVRSAADQSPCARHLSTDPSSSRFPRRAPKTTTTIRRALHPRNLFDIAVGDDNLFNGDRYKWSARFTVINLTNKTRSTTSCLLSAGRIM